jgi:hypothetical protein
MGMKTTRKRYSASLKAKVALEAIRRQASAVLAPCASTISTSRSLPIISSYASAERRLAGGMMDRSLGRSYLRP